MNEIWGDGALLQFTCVQRLKKRMRYSSG